MPLLLAVATHTFHALVYRRCKDIMTIKLNIHAPHECRLTYIIMQCVELKLNASNNYFHQVGPQMSRIAVLLLNTTDAQANDLKASSIILRILSCN